MRLVQVPDRQVILALAHVRDAAEVEGLRVRRIEPERLDEVAAMAIKDPSAPYVAPTEGGGFHVEEYKKPEYEVRVTPSVRRVLQGR